MRSNRGENVRAVIVEAALISGPCKLVVSEWGRSLPTAFPRHDLADIMVGSALDILEERGGAGKGYILLEQIELWDPIPDLCFWRKLRKSQAFWCQRPKATVIPYQ